MAISLGSNLGSLAAQRQLGRVSAESSKVYERLSSGQRITRASDDAAGLAIADALTTNRRVFSQGVRNLNDGISLLNIADGAIEQLSTIVIRLKELAEQSASGTYGTKQRTSLDAEAQALSKEYFRITQSTKFNGRNLFDQNFGELRLQGGFGLEGGIQSGLGGAIGTGSMGAAVSYATGGSASAVAVGDVNGDGILDLVNAEGANVAVRLGLGSGNFGSAATYAAEILVSNEVAVGDLNGDGMLDLISAGWAGVGGWATIRLGNGDGTFGSAVSYATETNRSFDMALGDLNGDGFLDLVTAGIGSGGTTTVRLNAGNGTFGAALSYLNTSESVRSNGVTLGDLNGDGMLDLVTAGRSSALDGFVTVRLGRGDGSFGSGAVYAAESRDSEDVVLGDLNGDGLLDLITAGYSDANDGYATVRLGKGNGTFGNAVSYATETGLSWGVDIGDLNGDGLLDLITAGRTDTPTTDGYATVRLGRGDGSFGSAASYLTESDQSTDVNLADLDEDGVPDLITGGSGTGNRVTIRFAKTTFGVQPLLPFSLASRADALQALPIFEQKLRQLSQQRATIGAFQSRVAAATNVLQAAGENFYGAESRIRDADLAEETALLARLNILQQGGRAVIANANQQPALALRLLQD